MYDEALKTIPGEHWRAGEIDYLIPSRQVYHAVETADFYSGASPDDFPWGQRFDCGCFDSPPEELPSREQAREYHDGLGGMSSVYTDLDNVIRTFERQESGAHGPHPGDIFNLVANHADRAVRVEAILRLGVVKLTCVSRGDHKRVRDLINEKLDSDDPIEQAAAKCADALDEKGLNRLISGN